MALTLTQLLADQAVVFSDFPTNTITISGVDYNALVIERSDGNEFGDGGLVRSRTLRVAIERSTVSTVPTQGTTATFDSITYRIGEVRLEDDGGSMILILENTLTR